MLGNGPFMADFDGVLHTMLTPCLMNLFLHCWIGHQVPILQYWKLLKNQVELNGDVFITVNFTTFPLPLETTHVKKPTLTQA